MRMDDMFDDSTYFQDSPDNSMYGDELDLLGNEVIEELELMGYDLDQIDYMGGPFKRLFRKIRDRIRARRKKRAEKKARSAMGPDTTEVPYSVSTPRGTLTASSAGLSLIKPAGGMVPVQAQTGFNPMEMIQKNPMLLLIPVAGIAIMMMGRKRRGNGGGGRSRKRRR